MPSVNLLFYKRYLAQLIELDLFVKFNNFSGNSELNTTNIVELNLPQESSRVCPSAEGGKEMIKCILGEIAKVVAVILAISASVFCAHLGVELTTEGDIPTIVVGWVLVALAVVIPLCAVLKAYERD